MRTFDRIMSKPCEQTHAEANIKARLSAKYMCVKIKFEMAVIHINEALDRIKDK